MKTKPILLKQLRINPLIHRTISIVGAGGKTSLMNRLREELVSLGLRVIMTTSTHILYDSKQPSAFEDEESFISDLINRHGYAVVGKPYYREQHQENETVMGGESHIFRKLSPLDPVRLRELGKLCDVMLIEADGARHMQIKVPSYRDPVIYPWTDMLITVASSAAIGKQISDVAYRPEELAGFLGKCTADRITCEDIFRIAKAETWLKGRNVRMAYRFYLNAVENAEVPYRELEASMQYLRDQRSVNAYCGSLHNADEIGAVVLAAGCGKRFGSNKLICDFMGKPVYRHALDAMIDIFGAEKVTLVTSYDIIAEDCRSCGVKVIMNESPESGISSSMKLGLLANLDKGSCLFSVADQPLITSETIAAMIRGYHESDKGMAALSAGGQTFSNPCIFSAAYYADLLRVMGDRGGKIVMNKYPHDVLTFVPEKGEELFDIDTEEDLKVLQLRTSFASSN